MTKKLGFLAIARPTFDLPLAESTARDVLRALEDLNLSLVGDARLLLDPETAAQQAAAISREGVEAIVVIQATFADSSLVSAVADKSSVPLVLWAVPEEQVGGRLRLNSLCGINLAAYVLARRGKEYSWIYRSPNDPRLNEEIFEVLEAPRHVASLQPNSAAPGASSVTLAGKVIGVIGDRPDGFEPCEYDEAELFSLTGLKVDRVELIDWFEAGTGVSDSAVDEIQDHVATTLFGVGGLDAAAVRSSIRLAAGLEVLANDRGWSGVATRCWPECFTEFGGAACFGNSRMSSRGLPGSCEADVYGNVTALLLQSLSNLPPFVADLVGLDFSANTATFWHCGMAATELAAPGERLAATVHSNREKPLLNQFRLRPGEVTIARLSQSLNRIRMVVGVGKILDEPLPFSGTSGVARLESEAVDVFDTIMANGLEHHYGIAYGDHRNDVIAYAKGIGIDVVHL
jgi:L-fucose isomerase-like protein